MNKFQRNANRRTAANLWDEVNLDKYGNPKDGNSLPFCCFPDCGCDGARLCMAKSGASDCSMNINIEKGSLKNGWFL
jgi:hypothetical protein